MEQRHKYSIHTRVPGKMEWLVQWVTNRSHCMLYPTLLEFLTSLFKENLHYRTINMIQSAISVTHNHIEGIPMGQHPLVLRLLKAVYNTCPPQPRYSVTWDVDVVIRYFQSLGENDNLTLKQLSKKLVLLMALVEASRVSELQALDLRYQSYHLEGVHGGVLQ